VAEPGVFARLGMTMCVAYDDVCRLQQSSTRRINFSGRGGWAGRLLRLGRTRACRNSRVNRPDPEKNIAYYTIAAHGVEGKGSTELLAGLVEDCLAKSAACPVQANFHSTFRQVEDTANFFDAQVLHITQHED